MLHSRDSRVLQRKDKNKFEISKEILLLLFIPYSKSILKINLFSIIFVTVKNIRNSNNEIR